MSIRIRHTVASALGVLLTGSMLTLTAVGQSTYGTEPTQNTDTQKKHAACEQLKGKQQVDCEKRMTDMDKKSKADASSVPSSEDKKPPTDAPPK